MSHKLVSSYKHQDARAAFRRPQTEDWTHHPSEVTSPPRRENSAYLCGFSMRILLTTTTLYDILKVRKKTSPGGWCNTPGARPTANQRRHCGRKKCSAKPTRDHQPRTTRMPDLPRCWRD